MTLLPNSKNILEIVDDKEKIGEHRTYLGYSQCGKKCSRELWYSLHWASERTISSRLQRIFDTGHIFEDFMTKSLVDAGVKVYDDQLEIIGPYEHVMGHIDGKCIGVPGAEKIEHLLEMKTMNDKNFKKTVKEGVRLAKPEYYAQMQAYMGKLGLTRALFMSYNKNTSEYHFERIEYDKNYFEQIERRLIDVLYAEFPPERIGNKTWFECKYCDFFNICQNGEGVVENCRMCKHASIENNAGWSCDLKEKELSTSDQKSGCRSWEQLEGL